MSLYYDFDGNPIDDQLEWARLFEDLPARQVARTDLDGGVYVSTVWLGLDHRFSVGPGPLYHRFFGLGDGPPLIYETMIFGGPHDEWCWRWPNRDAALAGHDQAVALALDQNAARR